MNLNLYIIKEDLPEYNWEGTISDPLYIARCEYALLGELTDERLDERAMHIFMAETLVSIPQENRNLSIICIGKPTEDSLKCFQNLIYTEKTDSTELYTKLVKLYHRYNSLENELRNIVDEGRSIQEFNDTIVEHINNPMYGHNSSYYVPFFFLPNIVKQDPSYHDYYINVYTKSGTSWSDEIVYALITDVEYREAEHAVVPTIFSGKNFGFRSLFYNVWNGQTLLSRIMIDELICPIKDKDYILIQLIGKYLKASLIHAGSAPMERPKDLDSVLGRLLSHVLVPENNIVSILTNYQWYINDIYVCVAAKLKNGPESFGTLNSIAGRLSGKLNNSCYTVYEDTIVFIFNLRTTKNTPEQLMTKLQSLFESYYLQAGYSSVFNDFKNLYYYYQQSIASLYFGTNLDPGQTQYQFDNYVLENMLNRIKKGTIPEALVPNGLKELISYDNKKGTSYVKLLGIYLDSECSVIKTARKAYLHKNTFLYQLEKIKSILKMDLENADVRLLLQIALRLITDSNKK